MKGAIIVLLLMGAELGIGFLIAEFKLKKDEKYQNQKNERENQKK